MNPALDALFSLYYCRLSVVGLENLTKHFIWDPASVSPAGIEPLSLSAAPFWLGSEPLRIFLRLIFRAERSGVCSQIPPAPLSFFSLVFFCFFSVLWMVRPPNLLPTATRLKPVFIPASSSRPSCCSTPIPYRRKLNCILIIFALFYICLILFFCRNNVGIFFLQKPVFVGSAGGCCVS